MAETNETNNQTNNQTVTRQASFEPVIKANTELKEVFVVPEAPHKVFFSVTDLPLDMDLTLGGGFRRDLVGKVNYCRHYKDKTELLKAHLEIALEKVNLALEELNKTVEVVEKVDRIVETNEDIQAKYKAEIARLEALLTEGGV